MELTIENVETENGAVVRARKGRNVAHVMRAVPNMLGTFGITGLCGRSVGTSGDADVATGTDVAGKTCARCDKIVAALLAELETGTDTGEDSAPAERAELIRQERQRRAARACDGTGKAPVPGTRVLRDDSAVSVPEDYNGKHSGKCPEETCGRIIAVSREGVMRRHNRSAAREDSAPVLPGTETVGATGKTESEMRDAVERYYAKGGKVPPEVAALPDPTVKRAQWSGTDAREAGAVVACDYKGDVEIINPERTHGKCPECRAYITLLDVKSDPDAQRIGKHNRYGVATPAGAGLSSKSMDTVEHGSIPGDPATADKRRAEESRCKRSGKILAGAEGGTVPCPECARPVELIKKISVTKKGTKIKWQVPNHVDPRDTFRRAGANGKGERKVTPRGTGADAGKGQRDHGSVDGSATTGRQNMPPVRPGGWVGKAGTTSLPATVRPGVDPEVSGKVCPICLELPEIAHKDKSTTWRRRHSYKLRGYYAALEAQRETRKEAEIAAGTRLTGSERRELRKAASVGSFAEGVNAHTGTVTHESRPVKAKVLRVKPRGATRTTGK